MLWAGKWEGEAFGFLSCLVRVRTVRTEAGTTCSAWLRLPSVSSEQKGCSFLEGQGDRKENQHSDTSQPVSLSATCIGVCGGRGLCVHMCTCIRVHRYMLYMCRPMYMCI